MQGSFGDFPSMILCRMPFGKRPHHRHKFIWGQYSAGLASDRSRTTKSHQAAIVAHGYVSSARR